MEKEYDYAPLAQLVKDAAITHAPRYAYWYAEDLAAITLKHAYRVDGADFIPAAFYAACGGEVAALALRAGLIPADIVYMTVTD